MLHVAVVNREGYGAPKLSVAGVEPAEGEGRSKRQAEQVAAARLLERVPDPPG